MERVTTMAAASAWRYVVVGSALFMVAALAFAIWNGQRPHVAATAGEVPPGCVFYWPSHQVTEHRISCVEVLAVLQMNFPAAVGEKVHLRRRNVGAENCVIDIMLLSGERVAEISCLAFGNLTQQTRIYEHGGSR